MKSPSPEEEAMADTMSEKQVATPVPGPPVLQEIENIGSEVEPEKEGGVEEVLHDLVLFLIILL